MANTTTYGNIYDRALSIADSVEQGPAGTDFITSADMLAWINEGLTELYELLTDSDEDYFTATQDLTLVASTAEYNLTTDPYRIIAAFYVETNGQRYPLPTVNLTDLHKLPLSANNRDLRWSLFGSSSNKVQIKFFPTPGSAGTVEFIYVPEVTLFDGTVGTAITSVFPRASEEYIIMDTAAKILEKQELDPSSFLARKGQALQRIAGSISGRRPKQPNGHRPRGNFHLDRRRRGLSHDNNMPPEF
jgi:hypothetical protein